MINAFSSNLNLLNLHLKITPYPFYKIMKRFFLKVNSLKVSKVASYSVSPMLTLTWGIDILFEKLTPEKGDGFENHPLHYVSRGGNFMQSLSSFLIRLVMISILML